MGELGSGMQSWVHPYRVSRSSSALQSVGTIRVCRKSSPGGNSEKLGTCEASWFDSISNRTYDSRFNSYWWSDSKFSNRHSQRNDWWWL